MKPRALGALVLSLAVLALPSAQGLRPDTVFFEDLTFEEIRDAIGAGTINVIIATGGVEDAGAQLVASASTDVVTYTADRIARSVGSTFVAPVIAYAPTGLVSVPSDQGYAGLIEAAAVSAKGSGFRNIFLLGEAESSQGVLASIAGKLDAAWRGDGVRVVHLADYTGKARQAQDRYLFDTLGVRLPDVGERERFVGISEVLAINGRRVRLDGKDRSPAVTPAPHIGLALLDLKVEAAVAQIAGSLSKPLAPALAVSDRRVLPTPHPSLPSGPSVFLEDLTGAEIREAIAAGNTTAILPTGGTEKNGFHMAVGKHNFHVRAGAQLMAKRLGNALISPVLQYVPEGQATSASPGVLACGRQCFEPVVLAVARALKAVGFTEVLLIGDNGGNQASLSAVATLLNKEWVDSGAQAFALTDFYDKGHEYQDAWFLGQFGWDETVVGSHAGIKDTSQLLYVKPEDVRRDRIADSFANQRESGISGDPTKATAEFGRVAIEFKANAAVAQYRGLRARQQTGDRPARRGRQ